MLPPGVHFLSFQARSRKDATLSPPVSTFLLLKPQQVVVRRWDAATEGLVDLEEEEVSLGLFGGGGSEHSRRAHTWRGKGGALCSCKVAASSCMDASLSSVSMHFCCCCCNRIRPWCAAVMQQLRDC
jgi:hypothetical protein